MVAATLQDVIRRFKTSKKSTSVPLSFDSFPEKVCIKSVLEWGKPCGVILSLHTKSGLEFTSCLENDDIHMNFIHSGNRTKTSFKQKKQTKENRLGESCLVFPF